MSETIKEETAEAVQAEPQGLTLEKFEEATEVVSKVISETKLVYSEYFSNLTGNKVYLKPENMQLTGAYKLDEKGNKIPLGVGSQGESPI